MKTPGKISFLSSTARKTRHILAGWLLPFVLGCVSAASASDVQFSDGNYSVSGSSVTLSMYDIQNYSANTTGTLRMELWVFDSPWAGQSGSINNGYRLAVSPPLGQLGPDSFFTGDPVTETVPFGNPPAGTYYITLFLTEEQGGSFDDGYEVTSFVNFQNTVTFNAVPASGAAFGFSSAVAVGSGYYYDADVGYMYSFGDGWIYVSNLNRYFYVDPGTDFTTGVYIYDLSRSAWTYTEQSFWPYVYYFNGTGWVDTGFN